MGHRFLLEEASSFSAGGGVARSGQECLGNRIRYDCLCFGNSGGFDSRANQRNSVFLAVNRLLFRDCWDYSSMDLQEMYQTNGEINKFSGLMVFRIMKTLAESGFVF